MSCYSNLLLELRNLYGNILKLFFVVMIFANDFFVDYVSIGVSRRDYHAVLDLKTRTSVQKGF